MALLRYQNQIPNLVERFFDGGLDHWNRNHFSDTNTTLPTVNIKENNNAFKVEVAAPSFEKSDFNIELNNDLLTISSEKQINNEEKDGEKISKQEFSYQSFSRSFTLPELVEGDRISAEYKNGILVIDIPKKEEAIPKPVKRIKVK